MNSYELRQELRRQRLEAAARKARDEATGRFKRAHEAVDGIPFGQPILVGHHSEKRHRAALARHDGNMRKGFEAQEKAAYYEGAADSVGKGGISSDDPDAVDKLVLRLAELEAKHKAMKWRNEEARKMHRPKPHESWELSNSKQNINRVKGRIEHLKIQANREEMVPVTYPGGITVLENRELNRVQIRFPGIPAPAVRERMKRAGFRWSPTEGAWQRMASNQAIWWAKHLAEEVSKEGT